MSRSGRSQALTNNMVHRQYVTAAAGDGVKTEFALPKNVLRLDDLLVFVAGLVKRSADAGAARDYKVRGLSGGYSGEANFVKFTAAPANGADILFIQNAD